MNETKVHLEHALLNIKDLGRSLPFYRRLLSGWAVRWEGRTSEGGRWIHFGPPGPGQPGYLSLHEAPRAVPMPDEPQGGVFRIEHIGFAHPDVNGLALAVKPEGIIPSDRTEDASFRRVYFVDPDGHELEFVQAL